MEENIKKRGRKKENRKKESGKKIAQSQTKKSDMGNLYETFLTSRGEEYRRAEEKAIEDYREAWKKHPFPCPSMTADMNIFSVMDEEQDNYRKLAGKSLKILLVRRGQPPYNACYALPGGFVKKDETIEQAARRELMEETGVDCDFMEQIHTVSTLERDPRTWVMSTLFLALLDAKKYQVKGGDDAESAEWFTISLNAEHENDQDIEWKLTLINDEAELTAVVRQKKNPRYIDEYPHLELIESHEIAFDHAVIMTYALLTLRRLVEKIDTGIVMELLPEEFTLTELQQVYEIILNRKLQAAAFRRKIADLVEETDRYAEAAGHRPSKLYRRL